MTHANWHFPFGQPVRLVRQLDRTPKRAFVLGVYASAVHARWIGPDGRQRVRALAVASEPYIFWRGDRAAEIIASIAVPDGVGRLVPADPSLNGPSGVALDELYLSPLGLRRENVWLCDLVPHSCMNPVQTRAIQRAYEPLAAEYHLPQSSVPPVPKVLADKARRTEVLVEFVASGADHLILLGDEPVRWFLRHLDPRWRSLSDFEPYGGSHRTTISGREVKVLPLAHPRQAARLGRSSDLWFQLHQTWLRERGALTAGAAMSH